MQGLTLFLTKWGIWIFLCYLISWVCAKSESGIGVLILLSVLGAIAWLWGLYPFVEAWYLHQPPPPEPKPENEE